jgi:hypothetical protein
MRNMKAGQVKVWLDQGPAVILSECDVEGECIALEDFEEDMVLTTERGWVIHLLETGEMLTVHEETLHNGEMDV